MNRVELLARDSVLDPAIWAIEFYGVRYAILAGLIYVLANWGVGRPINDPLTAKPAPGQIMREIYCSASTLLIFGAVNALLYGYGWIQHGMFYFRIEEYGWVWFFLSIPAMLMLHDTLFYWLHRAMHSRHLYRLIHHTHHLSIHPSSWATYSFHPGEAFMEALVVVVIIFVLPTHPLAFIIFNTFSTCYNAYGHCGREIYPKGWSEHWLGRWLNTSTAHDRHHADARHNYSFYFLFWDRLMGTAAVSSSRQGK